MTVQDAMKALAEALEPKPKEFPTRWSLTSPLGFWNSVKPGNPPVYCVTWFHVDFLHSEDASARLLEAMRDDHWKLVEASKFPDKLGNHCWSAFRYLLEHLQTNREDTKTAVFLAALAWKGIEKPEGL